MSSSHEERRWRRGARLAARIDRAGQGLEKWAEKGDHLPDFRKRVCALAETQWGKPVVALHLEDVSPAFEVAGRRKDGTIKGKRLVRRFFWNIVRGAVNGVANIFLLFSAGGMGDMFSRTGSVTGPANAQALGLVDAARAAKGAWLVYTQRPDDGPWLTYSPSHIAVVDSHHVNRFADPDDTPPPTLVWHAETPDAPKISPKRRRLTWPDGSVFEYHATESE